MYVVFDNQYLLQTYMYMYTYNGNNKNEKNYKDMIEVH